MKKLITLLTVVFLSTAIHAQIEIQPSEAAKHVGDSVVFTGTIMSGRFLYGSPGRPTLLNVGALYPNQLVTLVVYGADRDNFNEAPEAVYIKKTVKVWGRVELFKGKPQIVLHDEKQIAIVDDEKAQPAKQ